MFSKTQNLKFELNIHMRSKKVLKPLPKPSQTADMEKKSDIPITQIGDKVKIVGEDRL